MWSTVGVWSWIHLDDAAAATVAALERDAGVDPWNNLFGPTDSTTF
jgi:nucleoside-diphosphate-sugar epimerase